MSYNRRNSRVYVLYLDDTDSCFDGDDDQNLGPRRSARGVCGSLGAPCLGEITGAMEPDGCRYCACTVNFSSTKQNTAYCVSRKLRLPVSVAD